MWCPACPRWRRSGGGGGGDGGEDGGEGGEGGRGGSPKKRAWNPINSYHFTASEAGQLHGGRFSDSTQGSDAGADSWRDSSRDRSTTELFKKSQSRSGKPLSGRTPTISLGSNLTELSDLSRGAWEGEGSAFDSRANSRTNSRANSRSCNRQFEGGGGGSVHESSGGVSSGQPSTRGSGLSTEGGSSALRLPPTDVEVGKASSAALAASVALEGNPLRSADTAGKEAEDAPNEEPGPADKADMPRRGSQLVDA